MPITLKLGSKGKASAESDGEPKSIALPTLAKSNTYTRTVSFSEHNSYSEPEALASSSISFSQPQGKGDQQSSQPTSKSFKTRVRASPSAPLLPSNAGTSRRRPRSPTPPPSGVAFCLPLGYSHNSEKANEGETKRSRPSSESDFSFLSLFSSRWTSVTEGDAHRCLTATIARCAEIAGFDAVQSGALRMLHQWLEFYLEEIAWLSSQYAINSGRTLPNARDLLEAVHIQGQVEREDAQEETNAISSADRGSSHRRHSWGAHDIIEWRQKVPDFRGDYPHRRPHRAGEPPPIWAQDFPVSLVFSDSVASCSSSAHVLPLNGIIGSSERVRNVNLDAEAGAGPVQTGELLSEKSRRKEKALRLEIPKHLPELPALNTWKRTDAYPTNHLSGSIGITGNQHSHGYSEGQDTAERSARGTFKGGHSSETMLSRLESRLVSSRLVQTSLSSLIGKLEEAQAATAFDQVAGQRSSPETIFNSAMNRASGSPMSPQPSAFPISPSGRRLERERSTTQASGAGNSDRAGSAPRTGNTTPTATGASMAAPGRLAIRLRTTSMAQGIEGAHAAESANGFQSQSKVIMSPSHGSNTSSPSAHSNNLISRRGLQISAPALSLETNFVAPGWRQGVLGGASGRNPYAASSSPVTPFTQFGGGTSFSPWPRETLRAVQSVNGTTGEASGTPSAVPTPSTPWPFFASSSKQTKLPSTLQPVLGADRVHAHANVQVQGALPPIVNYKAVWYAKKV